MKTRENIKKEFLSEVIEYGQAIAIGNHRKANKLHKRIQSLYTQAQEQGQVDVFSELLEETDENVRLWAATFTLKVLPALAEKELNCLAKLSNITGCLLYTSRCV